MRFVLALLVVVIGFAPPGRAQSPNVTVTVTGSGASLDEAKSDAVRQAMQYALKQLIVVDRIISGDTIIRDRILSTMNGYIENYREKNVGRSGSQYTVEAEITVSGSRIENFAGVLAGGGGAFDGSLLDAEQRKLLAQKRAEAAQREARGQIFDRLIEAYPREALTVKLVKLNVSPADPNALVADMRMSFKAGYAKALIGSVQALAVHRCQNLSWADYGTNASVESLVFNVAKDRIDELDCLQWTRDQRHLRSRIERDTICFGYAAGVQCYALAPGNYCAECQQGGRLAIYGRFVDARGESAMTDGKCFIGALPQFRDRETRFFSGRRGGMVNLFAAGFNMTEEPFTLSVQTSAVDLGRAAYFVAVAVLVRQAGFDNRYEAIGSLGKSKVPQGCETVEEAVRHHKLSL